MKANKKNRIRFSRLNSLNNEGGFILALTMVILVILTIIGLSSTNLSRIELFISGNDRIHKETFYQADAGTEMGSRLLYDNAVCVQVNSGFDSSAGISGRVFNNFLVSDLDFSSERNLASTAISDTNRAVTYYPDGQIADTDRHTNLLAQGEVKYAPGSGLQMVSGYEGLGASSIAGGSHIEYDLISQHFGATNSQSIITVGWKLSTQIINSASTQDCRDVYTTSTQ